MDYGDLIQIFLPIVLVIVAYFTGTKVEAEHYKSITEREKRFLNLPALTMEFKSLFKDAESIQQIERAELVDGSVVISVDYFKHFVASLKNFFGGALNSYESLLDRARREAILRMKEKAPNSDMIINLKLETSSIGKEGGSSGKGVLTVEVLAYGTAISLKK